MTPEELERQLAAATSGIDAPSSAWSTIASRGRVRRHRRAAVLTAAAVVVPVAVAAVALSGGHGSDRRGTGLAATATATATATAEPTPSPSPTTGPQTPLLTEAAALEGAPTSLVAVKHGIASLYSRSGHKLTAVRRLSAANEVVDWISLTPAREGVVYTVDRGCASTVWTVRLDGSQRHKILDSPHAKLTEPVLSPDGAVLAYGRDPNCASYRQDRPSRSAVRITRLADGSTLWDSPDQADGVAGIGWSPTGQLTYGLAYCCDATVEVHTVALDMRLDRKVAPPAGCDWSYGASNAYVAHCYDPTGQTIASQRVGFFPIERGRARLAQEDTYFAIGQARPSERAHHVLLVAFDGDGRRSALLVADVEEPSLTVLLMTGITSADW